MSKSERSLPRVVFIGPKPPPVGGVSVYVDRLSSLLSDLGFDLHIVDTSPNGGIKSLPKYLLANRSLFRNSVVHFHTWGNDWKNILAVSAIVAPQANRLVGTMHMAWDQAHLNSYGRFYFAPVWRMALLRYSAWIAANPYLAGELAGMGVPRNRIHHVSPFLPMRTKQPLPKELAEFMSAHSPVMAASAAVVMLRDGIDVYGLDLMIEAVGRLRDEFPKIGLVVMMPGEGDGLYVERMEQRARSNGVDEHILFYKHPGVDVFSVWERADLFLRPTYMDGSDAISLREALFVGTPAVASDANLRPESVVVFKNRDMDGFELAIREALRRGRLAVSGARERLISMLRQDLRELFLLYGLDRELAVELTGEVPFLNPD